MVKKLGIFFAYLLFFILGLIYFSPKVSVYYFMEQELEKFEIVISSEELIDDGFSLEIQNANVSVKTIESALIDNANIKLYGVYNNLDFNNITLSSTASAFVPLKIENINITHSIFNPLFVSGHAIGEFGEAEAEVNILERKVHLVLKPSKVMLQKYRNTLKNLKKSENGEYVYDQSF